jgi:hypothetical protein
MPFTGVGVSLKAVVLGYKRLFDRRFAGPLFFADCDGYDLHYLDSFSQLSYSNPKLQAPNFK